MYENVLGHNENLRIYGERNSIAFSSKRKCSKDEREKKESIFTGEWMASIQFLIHCEIYLSFFSVFVCLPLTLSLFFLIHKLYLVSSPDFCTLHLVFSKLNLLVRYDLENI